MNSTQRTVHLAGRELRNDGPVFLVAETGTTCNGKLETALQLVDAVADAGMDAIKFQMINPEAFMSDRSVTYEYDWGNGERKQENMFEMFQSLRFSDGQWGQIAQRCRARNLPFFATVDYVDGVQLAVSLDMVAIKVGSWDIRHNALLRTIAAAGRPMVLDLGPASLREIDRALEIIRAEKNEQVVLLHCTHSTSDDEVNLRTIPYLANTFGFPVGYSADTRDSVPDLVAIGMGACMLEKRVTLNTGFAAHHHNKAVEPRELKEWVAKIRSADKQRGGYWVKPSREDLRLRDPYFVSITAAREIPPGDRIQASDIVFKRPGTGLHPDLTELIVGRTARCRIAVDQQLTWEMV
jgi:sialic acid synthase SpsE